MCPLFYNLLFISDWSIKKLLFRSIKESFWFYMVKKYINARLCINLR